MGNYCLMCLDFEFCKIWERVLEVNDGDDCMAVRTYLMSLNCTLKGD